MNRFDTFRGTANQLLFIVDTCQAGAGVAEAGEVASALREERPPNAEHVWFGILVSCSATDIGARDGAFGESLLRLFREGPRSPDMRRRWSKHDRWIRSDDLGQAVLEDWTGEDQHPDFLRRAGSGACCGTRCGTRERPRRSSSTSCWRRGAGQARTTDHGSPAGRSR